MAARYIVILLYFWVDLPPRSLVKDLLPPVFPSPFANYVDPDIPLSTAHSHGPLVSAGTPGCIHASEDLEVEVMMRGACDICLSGSGLSHSR